MYAEHFEEHSLTGCRFDDAATATPRLQASKADASELPRRVDLRAWCSPVENQLKTGSCVANALVGALELMLARQGRERIDLSRLFLYYTARRIDGKEHVDAGTRVNHAMAALLAHGICEERMWPFLVSAVNQRPTEACFTNARHYEAVQIARMPADLAMTVLAKEIPVAFGIVLPRECYAEGQRSGVCPRPEDLPQASPTGGHAMLIVGYDIDERTWLVRNSWGTGFGDGGYWKIGFDTMERYAHPEQFFAIGEIEAAPGLSIFGETVVSGTAGMASAVRATGEVKDPSLDALGTNLRTELEGRLDNAKRGFASRLRGGQ